MSAATAPSARWRTPGVQALVDAARPFWPALALAFAASVAAAATEPVLPYLMKPFLDQGFGGELAFPLWWIPALVIGLFVVRGASSFVAQYAFAWAAQRTVEALRLRLFAALQHAPAAVFRERPASQLIGVVVHEVQQAVTAVSHGLFVGVRDSLTLVGLLGLLFWLNWKLAIVAALVFPAIGIIIAAISRTIKRLQARQQQSIDALAYAVEENALGHRVVRVQNAQQRELERFGRLLRNTRRSFLRTEATAASGTPITQVVAAIGVAVVLTIAASQAASEGVTVGTFAAFITTMLMLISPFKALSNLNQQFTRASVALDRAAALLALPDETLGSDGRALRDTPVATPSIEFDHVGVTYVDAAGHRHRALDDICLEVAAGEKLALVGASGAGKSTLAQLLPRFIEPTAGVVRVDGTALPDWRLARLRAAIALVSQEVVLFDDSIAANVAFGQLNAGQLARRDAATEARLWAALEAAYLGDFVRALPGGLDAPVGHNGNRLSGGQRQRLAIARALFKDAPILVLDEATSALDSESETQVQAALERLMQGRTVILIAHRLSTIDRVDRIAVLDGGRLVELGSHAELLARGGQYARLRALQGGTGMPAARAPHDDTPFSEDAA
jgi:subfamily B ATP-binding cassette protein MsbA